MRTRFWGFGSGKGKTDWFSVPTPDGPAVPVFDDKDKAMAFVALLFKDDPRGRREIASTITRLKPHSLSRKALVMVNPAASMGDKVFAAGAPWQEVLSESESEPKGPELTTINPVSGKPQTPEELKGRQVVVPCTAGADTLTPIIIRDADGERAIPVFTSHDKAKRALTVMAGGSRAGVVTTSDGHAIGGTVRDLDDVLDLAAALVEDGADIDYVGIDMLQGDKYALLRIKKSPPAKEEEQQ